MGQTIQCRTCGHIVRVQAATCAACGTRGPGRNPGAALTVWSVVLFVVIAGGAAWLAEFRWSVRLGIGLVGAVTFATLLRTLVPALLRSPRPRPGSLVARTEAMRSRVGAIHTQLTSIAEAFTLAKERPRTKVIAVTLERLKRSYALLKRYHDRFDAQFQLMRFSLWMQETAAIVTGWEEYSRVELSAVYDRLVQRTDGCRVAFGSVLGGRKTGGEYQAAAKSIQEGLKRANAVADAMVARQAQLALSAVSPASMPAELHHEFVLDELATSNILQATEELEREYDRIIAEHELG